MPHLPSGAARCTSTPGHKRRRWFTRGTVASNWFRQGLQRENRAIRHTVFPGSYREFEGCHPDSAFRSGLPPHPGLLDSSRSAMTVRCGFLAAANGWLRNHRRDNDLQLSTVFWYNERPEQVR